MASIITLMAIVVLESQMTTYSIYRGRITCSGRISTATFLIAL